MLWTEACKRRYRGHREHAGLVHRNTEPAPPSCSVPSLPVAPCHSRRRNLPSRPHVPCVREASRGPLAGTGGTARPPCPPGSQEARGPGPWPRTRSLASPCLRVSSALFYVRCPLWTLRSGRSGAARCKAVLTRAPLGALRAVGTGCPCAHRARGAAAIGTPHGHGCHSRLPGRAWGRPPAGQSPR